MIKKTSTRLMLLALALPFFGACARQSTAAHRPAATASVASQDEPTRVYDSASGRFVRNPPFGPRTNRSL